MARHTRHCLWCEIIIYPQILIVIRYLHNMSRIDISIKNPCSEKWNNFEKNGHTGFCASCQKNVIDFTRYTNQEIIEFFKKNDGETCGRFKEDQLKVYNINGNRSPFNKLAAVLAAGILTITQVPDAIAQTKSVTGKVLDETNVGAPGINVVIKGTDDGTVTDADGNFKVNLKGNQKDFTLVFSFIGYETKEKTFTLDGKPLNVGEVALEVDTEALTEVVIMGGVCARKHHFWHRITSIFRK
jgi:hypothetical protein